MSRMTQRIFLWLERRIAVAWALITATLVASIAAVYPAAERFWQYQADLEERGTPVVTMQGMLLSVNERAAVGWVRGTKHRFCEYRGVQAFSIAADGVAYDALATRVDIDETGRSKPPGNYDIGHWRIQPLVADAKAVRMYVAHRCGETIVETMIANVPLGGAP